RARALPEVSQDYGPDERAIIHRVPCAQLSGKQLGQIARDAQQCVRGEGQCLLLLIHRWCADTSLWYRLSPSRGDPFSNKEKQLITYTLAHLNRKSTRLNYSHVSTS